MKRMGEPVLIRQKEPTKFIHQTGFQYLILIGLCFVLFFINLGGWDLWDPDEPRYAEVAREMVLSGNWVLPHLNGEVYFDKPPLFFWLIALSSKIWGGMTSFAARFPSALLASLTILLTFWFGKKVFNQRVGFFAALILATNVEFFWLAHRANIDATLTFFTTLTIVCFYCGLANPNRRLLFYFIAFSSMGLGFLAKLQIACIVPGLTIATFLVVTRQVHLAKEKSLFLTILIFFLIIFAWIIAAQRMGGNEYLVQLLYHKTGAVFFEEASHPRPFYYYFKNFPGDFSPWFLFLSSALIVAFRAPYRKRPEVVLILGWFLVGFFFFSLARGKRSLYLLPLYPGASFLIAFLWDEYLSQRGELLLGRLVKIPQYVFSGLLILGAFALPFILKYKFGALVADTVFLSIPISLLIVGGVVYAHYRQSDYPEKPFYNYTLTMALLFLYGVVFIFPQMNQLNSARPLSEQILNTVNAADKLSFFGFEGAAFNYYTGFINVIRVNRFAELEKFFHSSDQVFCLIERKQLKNIQEETDIPTYPILSDKVGRREYVLIANRQ